MASLSQRISDALTRVGVECAALRVSVTGLQDAPPDTLVLVLADVAARDALTGLRPGTLVVVAATGAWYERTGSDWSATSAAAALERVWGAATDLDEATVAPLLAGSPRPLLPILSFAAFTALS